MGFLHIAPARCGHDRTCNGDEEDAEPDALAIGGGSGKDPGEHPAKGEKHGRKGKHPPAFPADDDHHRGEDEIEIGEEQKSGGLAGGHQSRCQETADHAEQRDRRSVAQSENDSERGDRGQSGEAEQRRQELIERGCGIDGDVKNGEAGSGEGLRDAVAVWAQDAQRDPAGRRQQRKAEKTAEDDPGLRPEKIVFDGVFDEEETGKGNRNAADPDRQNGAELAFEAAFRPSSPASFAGGGFLPLRS